MSGLRENLEQGMQLVNMLRDSGLHGYGLETASGCGPTMQVQGKECVNFISNSYLGFSTHPKVIESVKLAVTKYGMGIGGSPLACGTSNLHNKLCERLAANYGKEDAILFASGYQALLGTIQGLMRRGDVALLDNLDHRSIIDGCALADCKVRSFKHNDMDDLADLIKRTSKSGDRRLLVVDSVYSMDGDVAKLGEITAMCRKAEVAVMIDEAHSLGVLGKTGKGVLEHLNLDNSTVDFVSGTFSKFAGAVGGFTAADREFIDFLRHFSSPLVFSASLPPVVVAAILASFDLLEQEPEWLERLWKNVAFMFDGLNNLGLDTADSTTPCIPIMVGDTEKVLRMNLDLLKEGVYCSPVVHPGVPLRKERLRLGVMASHNQDHLEKALDCIAKVAKKHELI